MFPMPRTLNLPQGPLDGLPPVAVYDCLRVDEPIVVDGRLDELVWQRVTWSAPLVKMDTGAPVSLDSRVSDHQSSGIEDEIGQGLIDRGHDLFGYFILLRRR